MLKLNKNDKIAFLIDFDGTITTTDTNDKLIYDHRNDKIKKILKKEKELSYTDYVNFLLEEVKITEENYIKFILDDIGISKGFKEFYNNAHSYGFPMAIVSGGFINGILPFLEKYEVTDIEVYANTLEFNDDNITVNYYDGENANCCDMGPCGNCKIQHYQKLKQKEYKVIFVGDGMTDQSVAREADVVFAKDGLEVYCKENEIDYIPWSDFNDINKILFEDNQLN